MLLVINNRTPYRWITSAMTTTILWCNHFGWSYYAKEEAKSNPPKRYHCEQLGFRFHFDAIFSSLPFTLVIMLLLLLLVSLGFSLSDWLLLMDLGILGFESQKNGCKLLQLSINFVEWTWLLSNTTPSVIDGRSCGTFLKNFMMML